MNIFLPSVEPIPIETSERIEEALDNNFAGTPSLKTYEPDLTRCCRLGAISILGLENAREGSPVRNDFALWCFRDFAKLDDGERKGLPVEVPSSAAGSTTNFFAEGDFWIGRVGLGERVELKEISLTPNFWRDWLSNNAFVCESMMMQSNELPRTRCSRVSINYRQFAANSIHSTSRASSSAPIMSQRGLPKRKCFFNYLNH